jgi:hypothetical protein
MPTVETLAFPPVGQVDKGHGVLCPLTNCVSGRAGGPSLSPAGVPEAEALALRHEVWPLDQFETAYADGQAADHRPDRQPR